MSLDVYSLCPGGRGKKIQDCCPDCVKDFEQIEKLIEGEQFAAGLAFVENLEKKNPDRACITEAKCLFLRLLGLWEQAYDTAKLFVEREPKNVVALTELATVAALIDKPQEAVENLVEAVENVEGDQFPVAILQCMLTVGMEMLETGRYYTAVAIAKQLQAYAPSDDASRTFLYRCLGSDSIPLMLRELVFDLDAPETFEKRAEYAEATKALALGQWKRGRDILESLLPLADSWPNLYRNLGLVEFWFLNEEKGREYIEKYIASPEADYESAVDMEQFLALQRTPSWDDLEQYVRRVCEIDDFDPAYEKMLSSRCLIPQPQMHAGFDAAVRPKNTFVMLDRPLCDKTVDLKVADVSQNIGFMFAYGKQTTRAARVELTFLPRDAAAVDALLESVLGTVKTIEETPVEGQIVPWTVAASTPRFQFKDVSRITEDAFRALFDEFLTSFADEWFAHPYSVLGGKSPKEALEEANGNRKVEALTRLVVDVFAPRYQSRVAELLRERTKLPEPASIAPPDAQSLTDDEAREFFRQVPIWRWGRVEVEKCGSAILAEMLQVVSLVLPQEVREKYAKELLSRSSADVQYDVRSEAYSILINGALMNRDSDKALEIIAEAGAYARSVGQSDGRWKVLEIVTRFRRQEFEKVRDLATVVFRDYKDDKETITSLQQFFNEISARTQMQLQAEEAYRRQHGLPPLQTGAQAQNDAETRLNFGISGSPAQQSGNSGGVILNPGESKPGGSNGGSKLWVPD